MSEGGNPGRKWRRKRVALPGALVAIVGLGLIWGTAVEPRFLLDVRRTEASLEGLPAAWEGRRIAVLADLQIGMWLDNVRMVRRVVRTTLDARPDVVLIAGDFVYRPDSSVVREAVELVRPLGDSGIPVFAVLGNHDYALSKPDGEPDYVTAGYLQESLEAAGIDVLENESTVLETGGGRLHLVGVGSAWAGRSRPVQALAHVPAGAPRVIFMHNPVGFRDFAPGTAPLVLAGHTHGGQIRLPLLPSGSWLSIATPREVIADGWSTGDVGAPGNRAYVSRGVGFSRLPLRLFCRPELTLLTLRRSGAQSPPGTER